MAIDKITTPAVTDDSVTSTGAGSPPAFEDAGGGTNSPNFHAFKADQTLNNTTWTKLGTFSERYDNGGGFNTSNSWFKVPSGGAGVYFFNASYRMENDSGSGFMKFYKNGSANNDVVSEFHGSSYFSVVINTTFTLSVNDYIELYAYINVGNTNGISNINFQGFKLIG